jgi:uncharacterized protein with PQ loop repeat
MIPWLLFIPFFNLVDWKITHKGGKPNYKRYNITKAVFGIGCFFLVANFDSWSRFLISGLVMAIFELTSFWLIYPEIRNVWAKKPFLYYDTVELDSGGVDFFFAYHKKLYIPAKIAALVLCILSIIVIYNR